MSIRHKLLSPLFKRWIGYEHDNFRGRQYLWDMSERGEYNCYDKWCAQVDHVSSVRAVKQVNREAVTQTQTVQVQAEEWQQLNQKHAVKRIHQAGRDSSGVRSDISQTKRLTCHRGS